MSGTDSTARLACPHCEARSERARWWRRLLRKQLTWRANVCPLLGGVVLCAFTWGAQSFPWRWFSLVLITFALGRIDKEIDP